jgi:hypothetical protein
VTGNANSLGCFNYVSSCLFIERDTHAPFFFLVFSGTRPMADNCSPTLDRAPLKNKKADLKGRVILNTNLYEFVSHGVITVEDTTIYYDASFECT